MDFVDIKFLVVDGRISYWLGGFSYQGMDRDDRFAGISFYALHHPVGNGTIGSIAS